MPRRRIRSPEKRAKTIFLTGGLNEAISNLELKPGELSECLNYEEVHGLYHGYRSVPGFERYSGYATSGAVSGTVRHYASEVSVTYDADGVLVDDTEREAYRSLISPVGVSGQASGSHVSGHSGAVLGCWLYNGSIYGVRYNATTESAGLYKAVHGEVAGTGGWTAVSGWPIDVEATNPTTNPYRVTLGRLSEAPTGAPNTEIAVICNGVSYPFILWTDDDGVEQITQLAPFDNGIEEDIFPEFGLIFNNRIYLVYPDGHLRFSTWGGFDFSGDTGLAGEFYFGSPITDIVEVPGDALIVFLEKGIKILKKIIPTQANAYSDVEVETFSDRSNAYKNSATRLLGEIIFAGDRGLTYFSQSDTYGDFTMSSLTKKVQTTYMRYRSSIIRGIANREKNQYLLFFRDGTGLTLTFDEEKKVKGATRFAYPVSPTCIDIGKDSNGNEITIMGTSTGYLMVIRDLAQSFDGESINSFFVTAYHNYGSPVHNKSFKRILFELTGGKGTRFNFRPNFDYRGFDIPNAGYRVLQARGTGGGVWGIDEWGSFIYKRTGVEQDWVSIVGFAVNMGLAFSCSDKHHQPHVIHNFTTTFQLRGYRE